MPWRRALSLRERLERGVPASFDRLSADPAARRRAERWRGQAPFEDGAVWRRRLAAEGLDEDLWFALVSSDPSAGPAETAPSWWRGPLLEERPDSGTYRESGLLALIEPALAAAADRWRSAIEVRRDIGLDVEGVTRSGMALLRRRLVALLTRTLVLELQIARLEEGLQGDSPEERFQSFVARLRLPEVRRDIAERYPVLLRLVAQEISDWLSFSESWLGHLAADRSALVDRCFAGQDPGPLVAVERELGDRHRGGRTVLQLLFASGRRLVYKPRSLALEETFRVLLQETGGDLSLPLLLPLSLARGDHGWVEWLEPAACTEPLQVERFFHRMGLWLGLFHLLGGTDLHADNLLAVGEHPVPLDLETLFHPVLPRGRAQAGNPMGPEGSVLRVGLLPQRVQVFADGIGLDWSGLGAVAGQTTPRPAWQLEGAGTEDMRLVPCPVQAGAPPSLPTLDGETRTAGDHVEAVVAGYREAYGWMLRHRDEWSSRHLARFAGLHRRIVLRPTQLYARLLVESRHPHLLQDALDRDAWFDRLWLASEGQPWLERWIPAERRDLERGDVPIFSGPCDRREIEDGDGHRHEDALAVSALDEARDRLARLSDADRLRQEELVRRTLVLHGLGSRPTVRPGSSITEALAPPSAEALLAWSRAAAERLAERAFPTGDGGVTWMVPRRLADGFSWTLTEAAPDLYFGSAGIALFLAHLGRVTGEAKPEELARAAVRDLLRVIEQTPARSRSDLLTSVGAFDGWGSVVYTLVHLARLWNDPTLLRAIDPVLDILESSLSRNDTPADLLSGRAGAAMALLIAARAGAGPRALELARRYGELLTGPGTEETGGLGWRFSNESSDGPPLTGFSHGTAGIAWVLLELAAATGEPSFADTARRALAYERALFSPAAGNWPDLRERPEGAGGDGTDGGQEGHFLVSWCHGAPGVALGRLAAGPLLGDDPEVSSEITTEIQTAVATTLRSGFGLNHCLCHGDLGNLDILLEVARERGDRALEERVGRLAGGVVRSLETQGWLYGSPQGTEPPGLMVGLAGIGYGCLRLAAPDRVPSLLRLSLPAAAGALRVAVNDSAGPAPGPGPFDRSDRSEVVVRRRSDA